MKLNNKSYKNGFIKLKNKEWADKQRVAGKVASAALSLLKKEMLNYSLIKLNSIAEEFIYDNKCIPTFKNYHGFSAGVCMSLNNCLVHGVPKEYSLQEGDIISFDLGCTFENIVADTAITLIVGKSKSIEHNKVVSATEEALIESIKNIKIDSQLGIIGETIYQIGKKHKLSVIDSYGGHGICNNDDGTPKPHAFPFISNKSESNIGVRIVEGMSIAIEPLFCLGKNDTKVAKNGFDVMCDDVCSHHEHTIFIHSDHIEIMTKEMDNIIYFK